MPTIDAFELTLPFDFQMTFDAKRKPFGKSHFPANLTNWSQFPRNSCFDRHRWFHTPATTVVLFHAPGSYFYIRSLFHSSIPWNVIHDPLRFALFVCDFLAKKQTAHCTRNWTIYHFVPLCTLDHCSISYTWSTMFFTPLFFTEKDNKNCVLLVQVDRFFVAELL